MNFSDAEDASKKKLTRRERRSTSAARTKKWQVLRWACALQGG
jgi:hypothetical protein